MQKTKLSTTIIFVAVILLFGVASYFAGAASAATGLSQRLSVNSLSQIRNEREPDLLRKALNMLEDDYYMPIDDAGREKLVYGAIQGMTAALRQEPYNDDFSHFFDPGLYADLEAQTTGEYAGVGILMGLTADGMYPEIISVFPETPAGLAGLEPDDIIVKIDEFDAFGMILPEVATKIKGEPGTDVALTVFRPAESEYKDFSMTRKNVQYSSVTEAQMLDKTIGYVQVNSFAEQTAADLVTEIDSLLDQGMQGLVLDLRNNSGGLFPAALDLANLFVAGGDRIVEVVMRNEESQVIESDPAVPKYTFPLVVLINSNSASSSEIFVGALKDHALATIVGETSYGKGVIQAVNPMEMEMVEVTKDGKTFKQQEVKSALSITIGKYLTPNGNDIHRIGIEPNVWYDLNNRLEEDPTLAEMETEITAKLADLRELRANYFRYLRDNDATRDRGRDVVARLLRGETVEDVPQIVSETEAHEPLAAIMPPTQLPPVGPEAPLPNEEESN